MPSASTAFDSLPLSPATLANLTRLGYTEMTAIQAASLPPALLGKDLIAQAKTGSGKTAAFALALLANLNVRRFAVQSLVLCPTRELADQVTTEIRRLARSEDNIKVVTLSGGVPLRGQTASLEHGAHIVVGTPGRVIDHLDRGNLKLDALNTLVLDEADRMLDMGFLDDIAKVARQCPAQRQTLLFSATYPEGIAKLASQFMRDPVTVKVEVAKPATTVAAILQQLVKTGREPHDKRDTLRRMIRTADNFKNAIIFCNRKREVAQLHRSLVRHGFNAVALHGDLDQSARTAALDAFRNGEAKLLIASDVAARGLDIPDVSHVFNFDVPHHADDYVHRIGRTGRAGKTGTAYTIVGPGDGKAVSEIEKLIGQSIPWADARPGEAAQADVAAAPTEAYFDAREPRRDGRSGGGRHKQREPRGRNRGPARERNPETPKHPEVHAKAAHSEPTQREPREQRQPAPVARIEEARHRQAPARPRDPVEPSGDHLPAFLLRPVRGKA